MPNLDLDTPRTALLSPVGIPPFVVRFTPRTILAMEDAALILAKHAVNKQPVTLATTRPVEQRCEGLAADRVVS